MPVANRFLEIAGRLDKNVFREPGDAKQKSCQTKYNVFLHFDRFSQRQIYTNSRSAARVKPNFGPFRTAVSIICCNFEAIVEFSGRINGLFNIAE